MLYSSGDETVNLCQNDTYERNLIAGLPLGQSQKYFGKQCIGIATKMETDHTILHTSHFVFLTH
jgi:hypothetical protein